MKESDMKFGRAASQCIGANPQARMSVADEIMDMADKLVESSGDLSERTAGKLNSICRESPKDCVKEPEGVRGFPPYFEMLRDKFDRIERNLFLIRETLDRVEL